VQELGGSIATETAKLVNGNIPYHRCHAWFINRVDQAEKAIISSCFSMSLESSLGQVFKLFSGCDSVVGL